MGVALQEPSSTALNTVKHVHTRERRLQWLREAYMDDPAFSHLRYQNRMLAGGGAPDPRVFFLVEAPRHQDTQAGRYLSGPERMVFNDILKICDLPQEQTYLTGLVKYSTPNDRAGKPEELLASVEYVQEELWITDPTVVVVFGRHLTEWMFPGFDIVHHHGWLVEGDFTYMPLLHPEAALRNPDIRKAVFKAAGQLASLL